MEFRVCNYSWHTWHSYIWNRNFSWPNGNSTGLYGLFEQMLKIASVSAVKIMQIANSQGIPTYQITSENISQVLPLLQIPSDVKSEIQNSINAGMVVTTIKNEITYNGWTGTGYIILDPDTGAGAYMISGGLSGGGTTDDANWKLLKLCLEAFLVLVSIKEAQMPFLSTEIAGLLTIAPFLMIGLEIYLQIKEVNKANISPETKQMLVGLIWTVGIISAALTGFTLLTGPYGIALAYLISTTYLLGGWEFVKILAEIGKIIYFRENSYNY